MAKNILMLFASFLLLHSVCVQAVPAPKVDDSASSSSSEESKETELTERLKLLFFTLEEFTALSNYTAEQGKILFKKVLTDPVLEKQKTAELLPHLANLTTFVAEVARLEQLADNFDKQLQVYELVVNFTEIVDKYNTTELTKPTTEDFLMEKSLQRNGVEEMERRFLEHFLQFAEKFNKEIGRYFDRLSVEEKTKEAQMFQWHTQFKAEPNDEKKVEIFAKFFELYDK